MMKVMGIWTKRSAAAAEAGAAAPASTGEANSGGEELSAKDKAQIRRQQVRRAQIQHRQRKANYVKQLELDVVRVRDLIADTERQTAVLRRENGAMRTRLRQAQVSVASPGSSYHDHVNYPPPPAATELFAGINVSDLTVTLGVDDLLGSPMFHVSSSDSSLTELMSVDSPLSSEAAGGLTPEQEQTAINFILSCVLLPSGLYPKHLSLLHLSRSQLLCPLLLQPADRAAPP